jgi:putative chitinase
MEITTRLLVSAGASMANAERYAVYLDAAAEEFAIDTPEQCALWLANIFHETGGLSTVTENLNYSAAGLVATWPKRFSIGGTATTRNANEYHRNPEKIANAVYSSRGGNGDEASGDGWAYRGRGLIQLTFRANYRKYGGLLGVDLEGDPSLALDPQVAARAAAAFWHENGCGELADAGNIAGVRRKINGGTLGLGDVEGYYARILPLLV